MNYDIDIENLDCHIDDTRRQQETAQFLENATELEPVGMGLVEEELVTYNEICNTLLKELEVEAEVILSRYFEPGTNQYTIHHATNSCTDRVMRAKLSDEELEEYQLMCALYNKCDTISSFQAGFLNGIPFFTVFEEMLGKYTMGGEENPYFDLVSFEAQVENSRTQHPIATWSGEISMYLLETYATAAFAKEAESAKNSASVIDEVVEGGKEVLEEAVEGSIDDAAEAALKSGSGSVKYSPINPCNEISQEVAESFNGATFTKATLTEDTVMYRVSGGKAGEVGSYVSRTPQGGGLQSQLDLALNPSWGNTTENITKVVVPKGTTIYEGVAAPQNIYDSLGNTIGVLPGGGNQVYIPKVEAGWFK